MKIVCISDTHGLHREVSLPDADLLIHAGDLSKKGRPEEIEEFDAWLGEVKSKFKHIVVIAGNHDFLFEEKPEQAKKMITNAIYLENEAVTIDGLKIWGSPVTPWFFDWAFNRQRGEEIRKYWQQIPDDVDILITHGPCRGISDRIIHGECVGCDDLLLRVDQLQKLKLFVCGHIHEGYGVMEKAGVKFVNASICDVRYRIAHKPLVFDIFV